jgi:hypothetical protein
MAAYQPYRSYLAPDPPEGLLAGAEQEKPAPARQAAPTTGLLAHAQPVVTQGPAAGQPYGYAQQATGTGAPVVTQVPASDIVYHPPSGSSSVPVIAPVPVPGEGIPILPVPLSVPGLPGINITAGNPTGYYTAPGGPVPAGEPVTFPQPGPATGLLAGPRTQRPAATGQPAPQQPVVPPVTPTVEQPIGVPPAEQPIGVPGQPAPPFPPTLPTPAPQPGGQPQQQTLIPRPQPLGRTQQPVFVPQGGGQPVPRETLPTTQQGCTDCPPPPSNCPPELVTLYEQLSQLAKCGALNEIVQVNVEQTGLARQPFVSKVVAKTPYTVCLDCASEQDASLFLETRGVRGQCTIIQNPPLTPTET